MVGQVKQVPQPHPSRITPFAGHPIVVGITPSPPELVIRTAAEWAAALGVTIYFAYADPGRYTVREYADGTVQHADLNPDLADDQAWQNRERQLLAAIEQHLDDAELSWQFRYLAGRPDRALTHLARAVDAAAIVVGTKSGSRRSGFQGLLSGSVARHLAHHQHRPILLVPMSVVDWKTPLA